MENMPERAARNLSALREKKPLIHNITNAVVMNYTANALLAMGASPVMARAGEEVEEMVSLADALVLNIGTPTKASMESMTIAAKRASRLGLPIVLDPVGSGATAMRTNFAKKMVEEIPVSAIRGNPSEILSFTSDNTAIAGIYAVHAVEEAEDAGKNLAKAFKMTVAVTGKTDFITDGHRILLVSNGHPLMSRVAGIGCTASAAIGAFLTVDRDWICATATALAFVGLAGEKAAEKAAAPGSFMIEMLNALYTITPQDLRDGCKIDSK